MRGLSKFSDQNDVRDVVPARADKPTITGPIEAINLLRSKLCDLLRWAAVYGLIPNVCVLFIEIADCSAIRSPADPIRRVSIGCVKYLNRVPTGKWNDGQV